MNLTLQIWNDLFLNTVTLLLCRTPNFEKPLAPLNVLGLTYLVV